MRIDFRAILIGYEEWQKQREGSPKMGSLHYLNLESGEKEEIGTPVQDFIEKHLENAMAVSFKTDIPIVQMTLVKTGNRFALGEITVLPEKGRLIVEK